MIDVNQWAKLKSTFEELRFKSKLFIWSKNLFENCEKEIRYWIHQSQIVPPSFQHWNVTSTIPTILPFIDWETIQPDDLIVNKCLAVK